MANHGTYNFTKQHFAEGAAPATPDTGEVVIYAKTDGKVYSKDDAGTETALTGEATADAHIADTSDAHDASAISIVDAGSYFTATDVEAALQELGAGGGGGAVGTDTIWNAKGDLAVGTGSDTASRLAVGTDGHVLTADSGEATGVKWAAASGGAGSAVYAFPLDVPAASPHASDDEFPGTSLDAKWTNPISSSQTNTLTVANSWVYVEPSATGAASTSSRGPFGIRQNSPTGSFTVSAKFAYENPSGSTGSTRAGIWIGRTAATVKAHILGFTAADNQFHYDGLTYSESADWSTYDGYDGSWTPYTSAGRHVFWLKIKWDAGTSTITFYGSVNGTHWRTITSRASQQQPDRMGIALWSNDANLLADEILACDWFRVTEP